MNPSPETPMTKAEEFSELLRRYGDTAYRMALHLTRGNETEARDLVQDGFLRIWRAWPLQRPNSFEGWMYRVLHNLYMDVHRRRSRHVTLSLDAPGPQDAPAWEERLADTTLPAEDEFHRHEQRARVARALEPFRDGVSNSCSAL